MIKDFLVELLTEELPSKALTTLSEALAENIAHNLKVNLLECGEIDSYASPRRLAIIVRGLSESQPDSVVERRGPALSQAYDETGKPSKAALGFARSCQVELSKLQTTKTEKGEWLSYTLEKKGETAIHLLPTVIEDAVKKLPIRKLMRWGDQSIRFVRPVHKVVMLYGDQVVPGTILGLEAGRVTLGHRFHHPDRVCISNSSDYVNQLEQAYVIPSFEKRRELILEQLNKLAESVDASVIADNDLVDEVTALVEWPKSLLVDFDESFLSLPKEVLITSMASHQKSFALTGTKSSLLAKFITVSNIESIDESSVIVGNKKVMRARLSDANFFYNQDKQTTLALKASKLSKIVFQEKLGSIADKVNRVQILALSMAEFLELDKALVERGCMLSKADLVTDMVGEFPSLQGVMGQYYAEHDGEDSSVCEAMTEQYLPRFSGDSLPQSYLGAVLSVADKIDTLVGIFGINQKPSGVKDPFKLRRNALGVIRILLDKLQNLELHQLLETALVSYQGSLPNPDVVSEVQTFILERFKRYLVSLGYTSDVVNAVLKEQASQLSDASARCEALATFAKSDEALPLATAFKRINKLLEKSVREEVFDEVNPALFEHDHEQALLTAMRKKSESLPMLMQQANYQSVLTNLADLKEPIDSFFDNVMVMAENMELRNNRLGLLKELRALLVSVADLSLLQ